MYIKIYNVFTQFNHKQKLNVNELYFYSQLVTLQTHENKVYINIDLLAQLIIYNSKKSQNIKKIKELLQSLKQKQIIQFNDTKNNNELLIISFCTIEGGYEPIPYEKFRSFSDVYEYYIYVCVARTKENMVEFSLSQWGTLLELSRPQTISKLKRVIDKGIICKREGKYTDEEVRKNQKKQEKNIYYLPGAKEKVEQKENVANKSATPSKENVKTIKENNTTNTNNEQEQREHKWYVKGSELTVDDLYIFLTTNDEKLKKQAEARINAISKNEKGKYIVESLLKEAQEKVKDEKRKQEREMLKQMTNAVRLKDGTIVAVDEKNIDSIDVNEVEHIFYSYYGRQHLEGYIEVKGFQTGKIINGKFVHDDRPDMIQRGWELYKQHVKTGEMMTGDQMRSIKDTVVPTQKNETVKVVAKKVENEYMKMAERAKREAEQKRKREIIDIAAIVVEGN